MKGSSENCQDILVLPFWPQLVVPIKPLAIDRKDDKVNISTSLLDMFIKQYTFQKLNFLQAVLMKKNETSVLTMTIRSSAVLFGRETTYNDMLYLNTIVVKATELKLKNLKSVKLFLCV